MDPPSNNLNLFGTRIEPPDNPGEWIGKTWRSKICAVLTCLLKPKFTIPILDANGFQTLQDATVTMGKGGYTVLFPALGTGSGTSSAIQQFKIVSDGGDYWNCNTFDGTITGGSVIKVAKPFKLRSGAGAIASEVIRSVTYTYAYTPVTVGAVTGYYTRAVSGSDGSSETDYTIPDPIADDIIYAIPFASTTPSSLSAVTWLDINADGRAWAT